MCLSINGEIALTVQILIGDVRDRLRDLPDSSVDCVVTSPPYWGLRNYGVGGQIGLESTPAEFISVLVDVFEEMRRILKPEGTAWVNMGDSYASRATTPHESRVHLSGANDLNPAFRPGVPIGLKPKDLCGMPWRLAFALQTAGWWLRQDIVWSKPNPMPESVRDRCTKAHEYIFLLSKSEQYFFDADAIKEPVVGDPTASRNRWDTKDYEVPGQKPQKRLARGVGWGHGTDADQRKRGRVKIKVPSGWDTSDGTHEAIHREGRTSAGFTFVSRSGNKERKPSSARGCPEDSGSNVCGSVPWEGSVRNKRSVWTIATHSFKEAHFATFPPELAETCILAGCPAGGTVLDPFFGAGTTGLVADRLQRHCIGIELNPAYAEIARKRISGDAGMFSDVLVAA